MLIIIVVLLFTVVWLSWKLLAFYGVETIGSVEAPSSAEMVPLPLLAAERPRNVVLMIADGAGLNHFTVSRIHFAGPDGRLAVDRMPVVGLATTHSANRLVTDSAAAATALATGHKTVNGHVGLDAEDQPLRTFFDDAKAVGKSTGIVVTSPVTDATPAAFYAHARDRGLQDDLALELPASGMDVVLGAGYRAFVPEAKGGGRLDGRDVIAEAAGQGYRLVRTRDELLAQIDAPEKLLGLFRVIDIAAGGKGPSLKEMTELTLERLDRNPAGFALMVEGSLIDDESHARHLPATLQEVLSFDQAVLGALAFAQRRQDTLVVVTSDHETGGLLIKDPVFDKPGLELSASWNAGVRRADHTGGVVAVYAYGPGALAFGGSYDNTDIAKKIAALLR